MICVAACTYSRKSKETLLDADFLSGIIAVKLSAALIMKFKTGAT